MAISVENPADETRGGRIDILSPQKITTEGKREESAYDAGVPQESVLLREPPIVKGSKGV